MKAASQALLKLLLSVRSVKNGERKRRREWSIRSSSWIRGGSYYGKIGIRVPEVMFWEAEGTWMWPRKGNIFPLLMDLCDPAMYITLAFSSTTCLWSPGRYFLMLYLNLKKKKKRRRVANPKAAKPTGALSPVSWPQPSATTEPAQLSLPAQPPAYSDSTNQLQTLTPCGCLEPPPKHRRKQKCLPISCAGFIKYVFWLEAKVHWAVLSVFIPVFHSLYQLSPSDLWALWRLSHTNKTFICGQIYNQATNPPHFASI